MLNIQRHYVGAIGLSVFIGVCATFGIGYGVNQSYAQEKMDSRVVSKSENSAMTLPVNPLPNPYDLQNEYNLGPNSNLSEFLPVNPLDILKDTTKSTTSSSETTTGDRFTFSKETTTSKKSSVSTNKQSNVTPKNS